MVSTFSDIRDAISQGLGEKALSIIESNDTSISRKQAKSLWKFAIKNNSPHVIEFLMNRSQFRWDDSFDPASHYNNLIRNACTDGHTEIVKILLMDSRVDPRYSVDDCLERASVSGHADVVKILLTDNRIDPTINDNFCIVQASFKGHTEVVKALLTDPRVDPIYDNYKAIRLACIQNYSIIVKVFLADTRIDQTTFPDDLVELIAKVEL
jgi:hypothetical protein